jgi:hypothetical protein
MEAVMDAMKIVRRLIDTLPKGSPKPKKPSTTNRAVLPNIPPKTKDGGSSPAQASVISRPPSKRQ